MFRALHRAIKPSRDRSLAEAFAKLGKIGLWLQIAIGSIPVAFVLYTWIVDRGAGGGTRSGLALIEFLTVTGIVVLLFTTFWFYRYTRLAVRIADPAERPAESAVRQAAWIGVAASTVGIVFSMLVMLFEVAQLLIYFLRVPQAGVPVIQTTSGGAASWISAADIVSLMALTVTSLVEVAVLALSLWLLFRTMVASSEYPDAGATDDV